MPRQMYLICYDISDTQRWREVFETCKAFGDHLQYSVFMARLTARGYSELLSALSEAIHRYEDRVFVVRVGPDGVDAEKRFRLLGKQTFPFRCDEDGIF